MQVHVELFSRFRKHLPPDTGGKATVQLPQDATVADLLSHLGITGRVQLISVNAQRETSHARILQDGDRVRILPFAVGG
jgi:sulfur carrier protein ThiS